MIVLLRRPAVGVALRRKRRPTGLRRSRSRAIAAGSMPSRRPRYTLGIRRRHPAGSSSRPACSACRNACWMYSVSGCTWNERFPPPIVSRKSKRIGNSSPNRAWTASPSSARGWSNTRSIDGISTRAPPNAEQQAVLLRHAIEAPAVVRRALDPGRTLPHPLPAPRRRIEERHDAERPRHRVARGRAAPPRRRPAWASRRRWCPGRNPSAAMSGRFQRSHTRQSTKNARLYCSPAPARGSRRRGCSPRCGETGSALPSAAGPHRRECRLARRARAPQPTTSTRPSSTRSARPRSRSTRLGVEKLRQRQPREKPNTGSSPPRNGATSASIRPRRPHRLAGADGQRRRKAPRQLSRRSLLVHARCSTRWQARSAPPAGRRRRRAAARRWRPSRPRTRRQSREHQRRGACRTRRHSPIVIRQSSFANRHSPIVTRRSPPGLLSMSHATPSMPASLPELCGDDVHRAPGSPRVAGDVRADRSEDRLAPPASRRRRESAGSRS